MKRNKKEGGVKRILEVNGKGKGKKNQRWLTAIPLTFRDVSFVFRLSQMQSYAKNPSRREEKDCSTLASRSIA